MPDTVWHAVLVQYTFVGCKTEWLCAYGFKDFLAIALEFVPEVLCPQFWKMVLRYTQLL